MSRIDTNFVKQLYSQAGVELTPEKLNHISNNYSSNEELQSAFELKYGSTNISTPEKKNSDVTSVSTSEAPQSESQQPQKKASSLSVGGKPKKTGASASSTGGGKKAGGKTGASASSTGGGKKAGGKEVKKESPFWPPIQTFQDQKIQEYKEAKKKEVGKEVKKESKSEDLINRFEIKPGEKIEGIERKAYEAQRNMPKVGTTKTQPVVSTKPVSENLTKKLDEKYDVLSRIPAITEKLEEGVKLSPDELLIISKQQDLIINQNYDPSISQKKLDDELNEYQFLDGISEGIRSSTNKFLLQPLTEVNKYFGGDKDFTIKKGVPLATEKEQAEKELIEEKGFGNFSKKDVLEKAKTIFLKNDELSQKINATDSYFSTLPNGHQVQRDLWIKTKADSLKSNEDIKKKAQLLQVNADRIQAYNDFIVGINKKGFASEEDKVKYNELLSLAQKAQEENDLLRKSFKDDLLKLDKDNEKLELLKFNYNDLEKSWDLWNKGVGTIIGGSLKLIGETKELVFEETVGRLTGINYEDPLSKAGDFVSSLGKEDVKQYRMMSLDDVNNWGDAGSWFGQLLMEQGPILAFMSTGGRAGLEIVSMSSGGSKIQEMEDSEKQPFAKKYSQFEKVAAGWSYYGAEKYTEKYSTFKYLDDLKSSLRNISSSSRELAENSFKKETAKVIGSTFLQSQVEGASEAVTELSNSLTDIYLLDDKLSSNEISKRMKNAYASGVAIGGGMSVTGAFTIFASKELRAISDDKDISEVRGILGKLETINKEINSNLLLTDQDKTNLEKKANDLMNKATSIVAKSVDNIEKFSIEEISNLLDINKEQSELKTEFDNLRKSAMSSDLKKDQYNDLNSRFIALEEKRNDILKGTYNEFNYLPEEEQIKFKTQAAEAIIQEQLDNGVERDNIQEHNPEVINKKAIEIYESNKQTAGQVSEQEKPAIATETETADATQQKTELQSQEKINSVESDLNNNNLSKIDISLSRQGFVGDFLNDYEFLAEGSEHIVYRSKDGKTVIKIGEPYGSNEGFMPRVKDAILINSLIGDGSLEVIGYYEQNGVKNPIYKQNYLKGEIASQAEVSSYLESKGFLNIGNDNFVANVDGKFLRISDTSENFIKDKDGNIFAIDAGIVEISENDLTDTQKQEINKITPKTETDAVQEQITDEGVLQPKQSEMGLQEMEQGDKVNQEPAQQGEEIFSEIEGKDLSDKTTYDKVYDFLTKIENDLTDIQDNTLTAQGLPISVVKTAIKAMKAAMVAGKMASEVISAGIDALKNTDWYNKKTDVEKANLEPSLANLVIESSVRDEGKSMAKAEEKKQMALTEKIAERAKTNVVKARLGKLSKNGIFRGRVSKVLSLSTIRPKDAKKILPKDLYDKYVGAIIKLAERGLTIKDANIPSYEDVYDEIIPYFEEFEDKKSTIQEKIYNGEDLTVKEQAFFDKNKKEFFESESKRDESKNEEKEKEIAKNKQDLKDLRSKLRDAFKKSNLEKGSKTFEYIDVASMLTDEQIDSMSNAMLKNVIKAFNSFINDGVAPGYFSQIYANSRTSKVESGISEIDKTAEKTGIYKYKIPKFVADVAQSVESFILNLRKLDAKEKMVARIEKYRGTQIDAALKIYRGTPIYDNVIAPISKKLSFFSSDVEKSLEEMNFVYKSFLKSLKASDDIFTSILRIRYAQLYVMQQSNKGTKSDVSAIKYFKATLEADVYSESENKKISDFIDYLESKGENYDIRGELTKAEGNAVTGIRALLDSNTESAYEERVFGNSNASPMIVDYVPVNGKDQMSDADINDLVKRFEKGSFVSGNLKEKTGTAHSIDLHPFSSAMSSIMSSKLQYHLRTEVLAIKRGINNSLNEAKESGNKQKVKLLSAVSEAIDSYVNAIVVGNKVKATAMDKAIDNIATVVSTALLASETRAAAEFITNTPVLLADGLPMLLEGRKLVSDINELSNGDADVLREFLKTIEASQITSLMDKMKSASEKAGYTKKGVFANVMSNEIPTSAVKEKAKRFATDNKVSTSFGIYRNFLISGSDNMSRFTYFFGKFADEFKKEYGSPIEVDKVLDRNSDYLKDEKVLAAIKKASETTNKETTELFGSNNPIERALVSLEASKGIKGKNPITKMLDYAGNYMNQFNRGTISAMRTNINVAIEEKNGRELRKFLLQALRTMGYAPATVAISGLIGYAFYSDDDDEEKLKESLGKLREDEDLIKEVNGYFDFVKNKQEGDKYTEEEEKYRKDLMEKLMKNPEFKKAYDANYSFFNNKLLTQRISAITEKMNEGKSNFGLDSFERMMKIIDGDKETYGGSVEDFVKSMAYLNSERGMSYYSKEKRLELMEKIEDYFAENNFFDKRSVREREGVLDIQAGYDLLEKLYNYREKGLDDRFLEEGVKMGLNYAIGAKGNLVRSSYETGAEYINRKMIEKKFDHYDYKKDKTFDRPITKFGLDDKAELSDIPKDLGRAITPAYIQYPTSMKESDIAIAKTLGIPFASSLNKAYNQKQKDEIYKETRGKFQENMLENINETALSAEAIRYILDKLEISMTEEEKEEVINIALTPGKGGDKGKTENKGRSSDRLKVGNKKLRGE